MVGIEERISSFKGNPGTSGFILDFDGTLSRIVEKPSAAALVEGAQALLADLAGVYAKVAVISGRQLSQIITLIAVEGVSLFGLYGVERLQDGRPTLPPQAERWRGSASRLARDAEAFITTDGIDGCTVEYKDLAVSIHFRNSPDPISAQSALQSWAEQRAASKGFVTTFGRRVVEMHPPEMSKGVTVKEIIQSAHLERTVVAGDDSGDVNAFAAVRGALGAGALTIAVSSDERSSELDSMADVIVSSPKEVVGFLRRFLV